MIEYLFDADCSIYAMVGTSAILRRRLESCRPGQVAVSVISLAEIALGVRLGKGPPRSALDAFLKVIPPLPFDAAAAQAYAKLPFRRARFDRLLAAHALSIGAAVVTNNEADFADVPGLRVENWTQ